MKSSAKKIELASVDDLFSTEEGRQDAKLEKIQEIPLSELHPFKNHPFKVKDDEAMMETADSIKQYGVLVPAIARPDPEGGYELVAGHRRHRASELAEKETMPVIVRDLDDDAATIIMVDSNLQRESLLPSERAFAYKMKLDAMKHQGERVDLTCAQVGHKLDGKKSRDILAEQVGQSKNQIQRYIRLTELITRVKSNTECDVNYYSWGSARISHILRNPFYKGAHLVCRTHQKGIRSNTYDIIPREEWEVIEGCHEAIVTPEEWEQVQEIIDRRPTIMKGNACPFYNLFHGLVYCATCGKSMQVRYEKVGRTGKNRFTGEMREPIDKAYYICQTYNRLGKNACTSHKIEARDLYNLVLKDIQELAAQAMKDADAFYQRLSSRMERRYLVDASQTEKERKRLEARNQEIDGMFLSLYTDKAKGILTEQRFMKLTAALEQEQEANQKRLHDLAVMQSRADAQESEVRTFIKEIRRYAAIEELDESVLNRLISKILIGEVKKMDGQKVQEVRIVYNFVGEIPEIVA